jgi:hypothetical protein
VSRPHQAAALRWNRSPRASQTRSRTSAAATSSVASRAQSHAKPRTPSSRPVPPQHIHTDAVTRGRSDLDVRWHHADALLHRAGFVLAMATGHLCGHRPRFNVVRSAATPPRTSLSPYLPAARVSTRTPKLSAFFGQQQPPLTHSLPVARDDHRCNRDGKRDALQQQPHRLAVYPLCPAFVP